MQKWGYIFTAAFVVALGFGILSHGARAQPNKVNLVDACLYIDEVFCGGDRSNILPDFMTGFAIFSPSLDGTAMLTVMVKGAKPNATHIVYLCPGEVGPSGYENCSRTGTFLTNANGHGSFHKEWDEASGDTEPTQNAVNINVLPSQTVLANCRTEASEMDFDCEGDASIQP